MLNFLNLVLLSNLIFAAGPALAASSFDYPYWEKLLHMEKGKSRADGEKFFLSPDGKNNAQAELEATIKALEDPNAVSGWFNYHPQCVFKERFEFLKREKLLSPNLKEVKCPEFDTWKEGLNAEGVTLIFSSSYPNNPSSLFGHTLLRLNQKNKTNDLVDYSVAFSAIPNHDDSGIAFALKGIFGGYKGLFEITKYYTKVNEYNNGESRDLIEYELVMDEAQLNRLLNHLWELYQTTYFDYYFTDENCSAVLADLLAVAYKDDEGINDKKRWFYLPGEMIKHFYAYPDKVKSSHYRPSLKKQMVYEWSQYSGQEMNQIKKILETLVVPEDIENPKVLDGVLSFLDFTQNRKKEKLGEDEAKLYRQALIKRSKLGKKEIKEITYDKSNMPELGHDPQKFVLFTKFENHNPQIGLEIRQGYHDLMSNDQGFDRFSQFQFLNANVLYDLEEKKLTYDKIIIADLISLHDYRYYDPQLAWKVNVGADRIYDLDCNFCHKLQGQMLGGVSHRLNEYNVLTLLGGAYYELSSHLEKGYRVGPVVEFSYYVQLGNHYKLGFYDEVKWDIKNIKDDFYNQMGLRHALFLDNKRDFRFESAVISKFGSFSKNYINHQVSYGIYF